MPGKTKPILPITRKFNLLRIDYCDDHQFNRLLAEKLVVKRTTMVRENRRTVSQVNEEPVFEKRKAANGAFYYIVPIGFYYRIEKIAKKLGLKIEFYDKTRMTEQDEVRLEFREDLIDKIMWRENQREIIDDILAYERGQYVASTGAGKSFAIAMLPRLFPRAKILVTAPKQNTVDMLYKEISEAGTYCGIYSSKKKDPAGRVLCCTIGMLHHVADDDWDILIVDEKHQCATIKRMQAILSINARYAYAFSANHEDRVDGADDWLDAMFGECRVRYGYSDAIKEKSVVPVRVRWVECRSVLESRLGHIPATEPYFNKAVYSQNEARNFLLAKLAEECSEKGQTMLYVPWVEHIYRLRKLLGCHVAHRPQSAKDWESLQRRRLVGKDEPNPGNDYFDDVQEQFEQGALPLVIANSVWEESVNFPYLRYLINGSWVSSMSFCRQLSGRLSRKSKGKTEGVMINICDTFNRSAYRRSAKQYAAFEEIGYEQSGWVKA